MRTSLTRVVALVASAALATAGFAATASTASAAPIVAGSLQVTNSAGGTDTGTSSEFLNFEVPAPCDARAISARVIVINATSTSGLAADEAAIDRWVGVNMFGPSSAVVPGPVSVRARDTWNGIAAVNPGGALTIVPGTYEFSLVCQNNLGSVRYEEFQGDTVTFTSPTAWRVNQVLPPGPALVATSTTVTAAPASVTTGQNVTLTSTVNETDAAAPTGTVAFSVNGGTAVTAPVNASGVASTTVVAGAAGTSNVSAVYSGDAKFSTSTGTTSFLVTAAPASATTSTLAIAPAAPTAGASVALNGTVANSANAAVIPVGTCEFLNGTVVLGTAPVSGTGTCSISRSFGQGPLSLTLRFVPSDPAVFVGSTSAAVAVTVGAGTGQVDPQTITVTIPAGQIVIQTPYTEANPLKLGIAVLAGNGSSYSASAAFDRVTIIDTRAGNPGWSAFLDREDFTNGSGGTIPALNSGFEGVAPAYIATNAVQSIVVNDVPANTLTTGPERFAQAAAGFGTGTVGVTGNFVLEGVSTSTPPGDYTATVVFTVG